MFAQQFYQNSDDVSAIVKSKPSYKASSIDWHIEKQLVPTNDEHHPLTNKYMDSVRK